MSGRPWSPARVEAHDRRNAAIHEAGHAVIARHVGAHAVSCHIFRLEDAGPDDKTWGGQARSWTAGLSPYRCTMIAVAGAVAEHVWSGDTDDLLEWWPWEDADIMSPTDWRMAARNPGEPSAAFMRAVGRALDLLSGKLRGKLYATARGLIVEGRVALAA